jgi:uncharacterized surface protein with fasciclin (FAS1) repeats
MRLARRITALAAGTTLVAGTLFAAAPAANALTPSETGSFLGALTATYNDPVETPNDGNPYDYDILTKAVLVTGANATLASLPSFTLFAPNDRAFEVLANKVGVLGPDHRYGATVDEKAVTLALVNALGADKIRPVLLYHVLVGAKVTGKQVLSGPFYQRLTMANGQKLSVTVQPLRRVPDHHPG